MNRILAARLSQYRTGAGAVWPNSARTQLSPDSARTLGRRLQRLGVHAPVVLGQHGGRLAGPVRDGALTDLATQNRKLGDSNRKAGCAHQFPSCQIWAVCPGNAALSHPLGR
jgi:hypothetical protein